MSIQRTVAIKSLRPIKLNRPGHILFRSWARLYRSRFPYQELAPLPAIAKSLEQEESEILGLIDSRSNQLAGFTLVEFYQSSTLLAYLATAPDYEGQGLARMLINQQLAIHLTEKTPYFFLEANPKLWSFYTKLGFYRIDLDYQIPEFYGAGTEKMGLFVRLHCSQEKLPKSVVETFVSEVFLSGYELKKNDMRYQKQMAAIQRYPHAFFQ